MSHPYFEYRFLNLFDEYSITTIDTAKNGFPAVAPAKNIVGAITGSSALAPGTRVAMGALKGKEKSATRRQVAHSCFCFFPGRVG